MGEWEVVVVGAGVEGSATAYALAKRGVSTLLLEQFPLPHSRGSSHGQSRITRKAYDVPEYTAMMKTAYPLWHTLQEEAQTQLLKFPTQPPLMSPRESGLRTTGLLVTGSESNVRLFSDAQAANGLERTDLSPSELKLRFGHFYLPLPGQTGVYDPEGGVLRADKCLLAFQREFAKNGGVIRDNEPVLDITPGNKVTIRTAKGEYVGKSVVLCLGTWSGSFLERLGLSLPLSPQLIKVCYWEARKGGDAADFPTLYVEGDEHRFYGLPALEYPGLFKFCLHVGPSVDPDRRDEPKEGEAVVLRIIQDFVRRHFPTLEPTPAILENCMYTWTPDGNFVLDTHPQHPNIVIGAGFSGHGFKLAPVVGEVLGDLATGRTPAHDLRLFSARRFSPLHRQAKAHL